MKKSLRDAKGFCDPDWIRTNGLQLRRLLLYPAELPDPTCCCGLVRAKVQGFVYFKHAEWGRF